MAHVIVLGLGLAGSAIAATLAERGHRVTALEQFAPLHERGSSHGDTRIQRRVPHEGPQYVALADASWPEWRRWGALAGEDLLVSCGGLQAGPPGVASVARCFELARQYGHPCEALDAGAVAARFGHYRLPADWEAAYQPDSGFVRPDATRTYLHARARDLGAELRFGVRVQAIDPDAAGVTVQTADGPVTADRLVVAAGAWLGKLLPGVGPALAPERRVIAWFAPDRPAPLADGRLPIFIFAADGGWYGMPTPDGLLKLRHDKHLRQAVDPDAPSLPPDDADAALLGQCVARYFRGFSPVPVKMRACLYTISPDLHFSIDRHPQDARILIFACCSGHGAKYAPAYGLIAADMVDAVARPDLAAFALDRRIQPALRYTEEYATPSWKGMP